jgi:hypothetical protein
MLSRTGYRVTVLPSTRAEKHKDWADHSDDGDLEIAMRIEVKHLSMEFTCDLDWPFRKFIVCSKHSYDSAPHKPLSYYYVNKSMTHAAVVKPRDCREHWVVETTQIKARPDNPTTNYVLLDVGKVHFFKL